jgi:hypothetical protein
VVAGISFRSSAALCWCARSVLGKLAADQGTYKEPEATTNNRSTHQASWHTPAVAAGVRFRTYFITEPNAEGSQCHGTNNPPFLPVSRRDLPGYRVGGLESKWPRPQRSAGSLCVQRRC